MTILLTGIDGYIGWPTVLKLSMEFPGEEIIGIDNLARRKWVKDVGSTSIIPIQEMEERVKAAQEHGHDNITYINGDLTRKSFVEEVIEKHKPQTVLHLAAQPSAPYSQIDGEKASYTQRNNCTATINLLWTLKEKGLTKTHFIETTTTGIYGAPNIMIPEGFVEVVDKRGRKDVLPFPNIASSWYHVSKGFDAVNMWLMNMQIGMPITDLRTSIVYGIDTEETRGDPDLATRFDIDFYFGTLFNRWCSQMIAEIPLTIYGSGNQIKPFISLEDTAQSIVNCVKRGNEGEFRVYNQLIEYVVIKEMAQHIVKAGEDVMGKRKGVKYLPNPRVEKEESRYGFENAGFLKLLGKPKHPHMAKELPEIIETLSRYEDRVKAYKDKFIPKDLLKK